MSALRTVRHRSVPTPLAALLLTVLSFLAAAPCAAAAEREESLRLSRSVDSADRREALRRLAGEPPDAATRVRVAAMAVDDPDAVTRGHARLLLSDWSDFTPVPTSPPARRVDYSVIPASGTVGQFADYAVPPAPPAETSPLPYSPSPYAPSRLPPLPTRYGDAAPLVADDPLDLFEPPPAASASYAAGSPFGPDGPFDAADGGESPIRPEFLDRPLGPGESPTVPPAVSDRTLYAQPVDATLGFSGPSGVLPTEGQQNSHFVPMEDRWRSGLPEWDRYGKAHPALTDHPYVEGRWWDPYNQNVLKGDYPIIGQHTFLRLQGEALLINEYRQLPTPTTPFESTTTPGQYQFFGNPDQYFTTNFFSLRTELAHGSALSFKPDDWLIRLTPVLNANYLDTNELGIVSPDVRRGTTRYDDYFALQEWFAEAKLADTSPLYDFVSVRAGQQPFTSDFRGFVLSDVNRGVRLFGTREGNRDQFNALYFNQVEKDTNSQLNTFDNRDQQTVVLNYFRQDLVFPGYTGLVNFHYNHEGPSTKFDNNGFLARPDPTGVFQEHRVEAFYLGFAGEGHIGKINVSHSFYQVFGTDSMNPIAGRPQTIDARMAAIELSIDRDWVRFRTSFFYSSGDSNPNDGKARGFDTILDNPQFAGGEFSFWQRQQLGLFGTSLVQRQSLVPDLRSSKFQGQSNFVNPGLLLFNVGADFEVSPKTRLIANANYLMFDKTDVLETFLFQNNLERGIGFDLSLGCEYRPFLNDNLLFEGGVATLIPGTGFKDLYGSTNPFSTANAQDIDINPLTMAFLNTVLIF